MKRLTSAQLFAAPKRAGKAKARLERAKLVIVAARERAAETAQQCAVQPSTMRPPTVLQRRRLVGRFSGESAYRFWLGGTATTGGFMAPPPPKRGEILGIISDLIVTPH